MAVATEPTSKFAQDGGLKIHYVEAGTGDPVICIHGGGPGASGWSNFKQNLPGLAEQFRVMLIDLPQFGGSITSEWGSNLPRTAPRCTKQCGTKRSDTSFRPNGSRKPFIPGGSTVTNTCRRRKGERLLWLK